MHLNLDYPANSCIIVTMRRYLHEQVLKDLAKKMVLITGPRQVGKTYLAKQVMKDFNRPQYLNYDVPEDRQIINSQSWRYDSDLLIFDEIHKMKGWKQFLKGAYDGRPTGQAILVTGSARLETFRQGGESLAGRYLHLRLLPISVREVVGSIDAQEAVNRLITLGGFPEPFLSGSTDEAVRWRNQYFTDIIREDILEFSRIHELRAMRQLVELLRERVGSPLSYSSLAEDLQVAPNTVKKYVQILESLYIIFLIKPYHKHLTRSLRKEPKLYFFDSGYVKGDEGTRLENACALALIKHAWYLNDAMGRSVSLHYIKTNNGREIDFALISDDRPTSLIEVKTSGGDILPALIQFKKRLPQAEAILLIHNLRQEQDKNGVALRRAGDWLAGLEA